MNVELPVRDILEFANLQLADRSLQAVSRRTLDYWVSMGLIEHPKRKGKAGRGLFPESAKLQVVCIRELQEHFNFTLADIQTSLSKGSKLDDVLSLITEVEQTYSRSLLPHARSHACTHHVGGDSADEAAEFYIAYQLEKGDEELGADQVATLLGTDSKSTFDLALSGELPSHGKLRLRFLTSEISEWKARHASPGPTALTDLISHLIDLNNELRGIGSLDGTSQKTRDWLLYWISAIDTEFWRLRRLCHEQRMKEKNLEPEPGPHT